MAKRRKLKKAVAYVCGELYADCLAIGMCKKDTPQETLDGIGTEILRLWDDMTVGICSPEPGLPKRKYFRALRQDMEKRVADIAQRLYELA